MKSLRLALVLLLVVLLPVRGALAAAMPCAPAGMASATAPNPAAAFTAHGLAAAHEPSTPSDAHLEPRPGDPVHAGGPPCAHDGTDPDTCNVCAASCSALPLPSAATGIDDPVALRSVSFPDLVAVAPTFQSDGQERPPRTC